MPLIVLDGDGRTNDVADAATPQPPSIPVVQTFEDWANRLGVHLDIFMLASMSCTRLVNCGWWSPPPECAVEQSRVWCRNGGCDEPIFPGPYDYEGHPCAADVYDRPCNDIARPISCAQLDSRGLSLRMTDGAPAGGWPVNTDHTGPPPPSWPRDIR